MIKLRTYEIGLIEKNIFFTYRSVYILSHTKFTIHTACNSEVNTPLVQDRKLRDAFNID